MADKISAGPRTETKPLNQNAAATSTVEKVEVPLPKPRPTGGNDGAALSDTANNATALDGPAVCTAEDPIGAAARRAPADTSPVKSYHDLFGAKPYVKDGKSDALLSLAGRAVQKFPELANTDLAKHVDGGQLGEHDVEALQSFLETKGYSVGSTGVDGKYGPRTHRALASLLNGEAPKPKALSTGDRGPEVRQLQDALREHGQDPGRTDGIYGRHTRDAVMAFQRQQNLPATGEFDDATKAALDKAPKVETPATDGPADVNAPAPNGYSEHDVEMLTRAIAAEARGESPEVWTAVAQAIGNYSRQHGVPIPRLVRSSFLSSNFDHNKTFYTKPTSQIPNWDKMRQAAIDGLNGKSPIGDRAHFYDTSIHMPSWGDASTRMQIGRMVFLDER